jgi:2'-5' RNA ligase
MRLFTGIAIAPPVLRNLEALLAELKPLAALKWSPLENLHITTRFIGEWPEARLPEVKGALASVPFPGSISIALHGFGFLPNPHRPRVFFAVVHAGGELPQLAAAIDTALEPLGCKPEDRAYHPHLTLARVSNDNIRQLRERIADMKNPDLGSFEATEFHLYLSQTGAKTSVYTTLASFALGKSGEAQRQSE